MCGKMGSMIRDGKVEFSSRETSIILFYSEFDGDQMRIDVKLQEENT
jgi:hypothetical protein